MRDALNKVAVDTIVLGVVLSHLLRGSALVYAGGATVLTGVVLMAYAIRDVICALLLRFGRDADPDRVLTHMCAAVMALLGLAFLAHPRGSWAFVVLLPAGTYFAAFVPGWVSATVWKLGWRLLEKMLPARPARARRRRR
jgi:hypothetical protein